MGGQEKVIYNLSVAAGPAVQPRVWCLCAGGVMAGELERAGVGVEILGMGSRITASFVASLRRKIISEDIDVVHAHGMTARSAAGAAAALAGRRVSIAHHHTTLSGLSPKQKLLDRILAGATGAVICCSEAVRRSVEAEESFLYPKTAVIYNGAPPAKPADREQSRRALGIPPGAGAVCCVASFHPHKGVEFLIRAAAKLETEAYIILAGGGPLEGSLKKLAGSLGIAHRVIFAGVAADLSPVFSAADAAVSPSSEREGLSLSLVEAMSAGKPLIGTRLGGTPEVVADGENGLLVPPADAPALARAIDRLISGGALREKMAARGLEIYRRKFTLEKMRDEVEKVYGKLLLR